MTDLDSIEKIEKLAEPFCRMTNIMEVGGLPPQDPFASKFGCVTAARHSEGWPQLVGSPMIALCQINCEELPHRPRALEGVSLITCFFSEHTGRVLPTTGAFNGRGWLVRAYTDQDKLVPLNAPVLAPQNPSLWRRLFPQETFEMEAAAIRWIECEDYPPLYQMIKQCPEIGEMKDYWPQIFQVPHSKVGGWPIKELAEMFGPLLPDPEFVLQLSTEYSIGLSDLPGSFVEAIYFGVQTASPNSVWVAGVEYD